jgi:hypothetical protein
MDGYMIEVQYDEQILRVHAKTKAARMALTGASATVTANEDGSPHMNLYIRGADDVEIPRAAITGVTFKGANMLVNGNLVVTTADGKYQLHFRKKQQAGFEALAHELGAV